MAAEAVVAASGSVAGALLGPSDVGGAGLVARNVRFAIGLIAVASTAAAEGVRARGAKHYYRCIGLHACQNNLYRTAWEVMGVL